MALTICSADTFRPVIQWIHKPHIKINDTNFEEEPETDEDALLVLDDADKAKELRKMTQQITGLLKFLKLAEEIQLRGNSDRIGNLINERLLKSDRTSLKVTHIRAAASLTTGNAVRRVIAQACVKDYAFRFFSTLWNRPKL